MVITDNSFAAAICCESVITGFFIFAVFDVTSLVITPLTSVINYVFFCSVTTNTNMKIN